MGRTRDVKLKGRTRHFGVKAHLPVALAWEVSALSAWQRQAEELRKSNALA